MFFTFLMTPEREVDIDRAGRWARAVYRIRQFLRGLRARPSATEWSTLTALLSTAEQALFARMPADAQVHSLNVLKALQASGYVAPDLAVAALLHDVGKVAAQDAGAYLGLWMRGPLVLLEAMQPDLVRRWADRRPSASLRYALHVHLDHARIGAVWAREAGCSDLTCWLIEHHQDRDRMDQRNTPEWQALSRLQWADGRN